MTTGKKVFYSIAIIWSAVAVLFLFIGLDAGEARMTSMLLMSFWGFPSALVAPRFLVDIFQGLNVVLFSTLGSTMNYVLSWLLLFGLGFGQWFVGMPLVARLFIRLSEWSSKFP